jgi:hypothetical protein
MLDYTWKSSENEADRKARIAEMQMKIDAEKKSKGSGFFGALGNIAGAVAGSKAGSTAIVSGLTKVLPFLSDARLKENITHIHTTANNINLYSWDWNDDALGMGAKNMPTVGVLAQEVIVTHPEAVQIDHNGYYRVDYGKLNLQHLIRGKRNGL